MQLLLAQAQLLNAQTLAHLKLNQHNGAEPKQGKTEAQNPTAGTAQSSPTMQVWMGVGAQAPVVLDSSHV